MQETFVKKIFIQYLLCRTLSWYGCSAHNTNENQGTRDLRIRRDSYTKPMAIKQ
jgi:hypothetical protein